MIKKIFSLLTVALLSVGVMAQVSPSKIPALRKNTVVAKQDSQQVQTGYGTLIKKYVSGSIYTLPGNKLKNLLVPNVKSALQGLIPGVHVVQSNGMPGSEVTLRIRGTSSIFAETEPLYIIDGLPVFSGPREVADQGIGGNWGSQYNPLSDLNPNDIQSIEILKDAASTSIYGARGGNGVVLITTKKGEKDKSGVDFSYQRGVTNLTKRINSLNGPQYLQLLDESWQNSGQTGEGPLPAITGFSRTIANATNIDNLDGIIDMGNVQQLAVSSFYGSDISSFYLSGSYRNEEGVLSGNDLTRYTARMKISNQITKRLNIGVNMGLNYNEYHNMPVGNSPGGGFNAAQRNLPVIPLYNSDGTYFYPRDPTVFNLPGNNTATFQNKKEFDNEEHSNRFFLGANFTYKFTKGQDLTKDLYFSTDVGLEKYFQTRANYISRRLRSGSIGSGTGREGFPTAYASYEKYSNNLYNIHSTLNYKKITGDHRFTGMLGFEYNYSENPEFFAEGEGFATEFTREPSAATYRNQITALGLVANTTAFMGYFASANYAFKDKYLLGATLRIDGSSRFGANNKFIPFPSVSAGWILSQEPFIQQVTFINLLKVRASYGQSGNAGIGNYSSVERWSLNQNSRYLLQPGIQMLSLGSPDLKPEKQIQFDFGLDYALFENRVSGTLDIYNKVTNTLILIYDASLSSGIGQSALLLNRGSMRNRGIELSLSARNLKGKRFTWNTELAIAHNVNKILNLGGLSPGQLSYHKNIITAEGHPIGTFYLADYAGIDPANGQELIYDLNGNKVAATSSAQIDAARKPQYDKPSAPKLFGGLNNTFSYKNFDLGVLLTFSYGNYVLDEGERDLSYLTGINNLRETALSRWTTQQQNTDFPRLIYNDPIAGSNTTRFLHDASYLRMKNITLGYSFKSLIKKVKFLKDTRLYISAQNLFTVTGFKGWDPEVSGNYSSSLDRSLNQGITYMDVPQVRTFAAGFNLNF